MWIQEKIRKSIFEERNQQCFNEELKIKNLSYYNEGKVL